MDSPQKPQLQRMQCKSEKDGAKYCNYCNDKNVWKYTLKLSWRPEKIRQADTDEYYKL